MTRHAQRPAAFLWNEVHEAERNGHRSRVADGVAGLAISGGGIRSATFALGVLERPQGLWVPVESALPVYRLGWRICRGWLSANCRRRPNWLGAADWTESISYLRRYSNYLSPQVGFFSADTWSMVTIWLRNTLLIQATVILAIACAADCASPVILGVPPLSLTWATCGGSPSSCSSSASSALPATTGN